jgi:tetratricopeptide (TPR) repeat protein
MFSEDIKNEQIGEKFRDHSFRAAEVAEERLKKNKNDVDALFYLGGAYGSLGRYYAMTRSYLNAYWYGKKGKEFLEQVVEMDPQYYDAYLGLGIFNYLADVLPRFVKILSFILGIQGDKEVGIDQLELAADKGVYTKTEAMFFLSAIYTYREREYEKAIKILNQLLEKYPGNPGALFTLGRSYSFMGECDKALTAFNEVLKNEAFGPAEVSIISWPRSITVRTSSNRQSLIICWQLPVIRLR